jgi:hypothetical protein
MSPKVDHPIADPTPTPRPGQGLPGDRSDRPDRPDRPERPETPEPHPDQELPTPPPAVPTPG